MSTTRTIYVDTPSVLSGDTLTGYNIYSDIDGLIGNLTKAEQEAGTGCFIPLSSAEHNITVIPVGATFGEYTVSTSDAINIDLINEGVRWDLTGYEHSRVGIYRTGLIGDIDLEYAQADRGIDGAFEMSVDCFHNVVALSNLDTQEIGLTLGDSNVSRQNWLIKAKGVGHPTSAEIMLNNVAQSIDVLSPVGQNEGDKLILQRDASNVIRLIYRENSGDTILHTLSGTYVGKMYGHFASYLSSYYGASVVNPEFKSI